VNSTDGASRWEVISKLETPELVRSTEYKLIPETTVIAQTHYLLTDQVSGS
jgi:hypothetical protein